MQYIAMLFLVTTLLGGGYGMWQKIQLQAAEAEVQVLALELSTSKANEAQLQEEMDLVAVQVGQFQKKIAQIEAERATARKQVEYTRNLFNDHDFANLMAKKPGLITIRMQKATDAVFADLRAITE
jgi:uncharacterized protein HemX